MNTTIRFVSLAHTAPVEGTLISLEQYIEAVLSAEQQATRASLVLDPCPPSGHGSDTETVRV